MSYIDDCREYYNKIYTSKYTENLHGRCSKSAIIDSERKAQREAIQHTLEYGIKQYPEQPVRDIWLSIREAHIQHKIGAEFGTNVLLNNDTVERVFSAYQSWDKSSGHAFETYIPEMLQLLLKPYHITVVLQKELTSMLNSDPLTIFNTPEEIKWLKEQLSSDVFDLYVIQELNDEKYVFGCLQSKTSIRDRVTRDREPSQQAMAHCFWSVGVTLNGDFFKNDKFQEMVNGGIHYSQNGWHGMYVIESPIYKGRIFQFDKFVEHAKKAALDWRRDRKSLTPSWNPDDK